jgi:cysteine desulfurase
VPSAVAFGEAAASAKRDLVTEVPRIAALRDRLESALRCEFPELVLLVGDVERLPNTSCIALPGVPSETLVIALDLAGIAVGAGAACSSGRLGVSPVLRAMGVPEDLARCAIRVSLGWNSRPEDLARCRDAFALLHARVRARETNALVGA